MNTPFLLPDWVRQLDYYIMCETINQQRKMMQSFVNQQMAASFFEGGRQGGKASPWGTVGHPLRTLGERCLLIRSVESHTALLLTKVTKPSILVTERWWLKWEEYLCHRAKEDSP